MDLLKKQKLQGWFRIAKQEGNTVFQDKALDQNLTLKPRSVADVSKFFREKIT